jgi:hypothetical protein
MTEQIDRALDREYVAGFVSVIDYVRFEGGFIDDVIGRICKL